ncbi:MAG: hypothetical protein M5U01_27990 [Ardenticatenaceae bacterium]|nr:hypothetical protein [Ardenticatenaceae bacterium]
MTDELPRTIAATIDRFTGRAWLLPRLIEWLEQSDERLFILTGGPGTGKSMIVAWLAGAGPSPADSMARSQLEQLRARVAATHFCIAASRNTAPQAFAENVANQLTRSIEGFGDALAGTLSERVQISVDQAIGTVATGGSVTGITIGRLDLSTLGDELSFDRAFSQPLKRLYAGGYAEPMLLLVDALDEAQTYSGSAALVQVLARLADLPSQVRLLVTTRPDPRVLKYYREFKRFDLIADAPGDGDDVRQYVIERLADAPAFDSEQRDQFAGRLSQAAHGIFLYAHIVLNELLPRLPQLPDLAMLPLPEGLSDLYHRFLLREIGTDEDRWYERFKPLLGLLAVAQAPGLTRTQLEAVIGNDVERELRACKQYLTGELPAGPFRPFHRSFADFLLDDQENIDFHIDAAGMHRQIADYYWSRCHRNWQRCGDGYGLDNLATHLFESADPRLQALITREWMIARYAAGGFTYTGFLADVDLAWRAALSQGGEGPHLLTLVRLHAARQVVGQEVGVYSDTDLQTMVWLGRDAEALAHARLRREPLQQCTGLLAIHSAFQAADRPGHALLDEVGSIARTIQVDSDQATVLHSLAVALAQAGRYAEADEAAHSIQDADAQAKAVGDLAVVLAQAGHFDQAAALARATADDEERARALRGVALAFAQAGEGQAGQVFAEAEHAARSIENTALQAKALHSLVVTLARVASYDEAHRIALTIEDARDRAGALIDLASALAQRGDRRAGQVFTEAEEAAQAAQTVWDRAEALIELAAALAQAGDGRAGQMFARAEAAAPRRAAFDSGSRAPVLGKLAVALAQAGDPRADRVFAEAQEIARDLEAFYAVEWRDWKDQAWRALAADLLRAGRYDEVKDMAGRMQIEAERATVLYELVKTLVQAGRYAEAEDVAGGIRIDRMRAAALSDLAATLARAGNSQATRIFAEAEAAARSQDSPPRAETSHRLALALVQARRYAAAEAVARAIPDPREQAQALYDLVAPFVQAQRTATAEAIARAIRDNPIQARALHDLSVARAEAGRFDEAEALARAIPEREQGWTWSYFEDLIEDRAWAQADRVEAVLHIAQYRAEALRRLAARLAQAGRHDESVRMARSIEIEWVRAAALADLATTLEQAGDRRAGALLAEAEAIARALRDIRDQSRGLRLVAVTLAEAGQYDKAEAIISELIDAEKEEALCELATSLIRASRLDKAWEIAQTIRDRGGQAVVLRDLAVALAQAGRDGEADTVASAIAVDWRREQALHRLALAMAQAGRFEEAEAAARSIENQQVRALALSDLGASLARAGNSRRDVLFDEAWELARTLRDPARRVEALRDLASALAQTGDARAPQAFADAEASARALPDDSLRYEAVRDLATSLAQAGFFSDALRVVGVPGPDGFVQILATWAPAFERLEQGLAVTVLRTAIDVAGWVQPGWGNIHVLLSAPETATGR